MRRGWRWLPILLLCCSCFAWTQEQKPASSQPQGAKPSEPARVDQAPRGFGGQLAQASKEAEGDENEQFKQSPSVLWLARVTGLEPHTAYWILVLLNFAIIAGAVLWIGKSAFPQMFRARTESIKKGLEEARRSSEEAQRRLSDIESRLSRLDSEIASMRAETEKDLAAEEDRIRASAEEDRRRIVEGAEQEIEAASRSARRDLKAYAADLAVALAEKRIQIDAGTDRALVHSFVDQLKNNGDPGRSRS